MSALPPKADICSAPAHVRFGSKADMCSAIGHVRFTPNSDIDCVFRHVRFGPIAAISNAGALRVSPAEAGGPEFSKDCFLRPTACRLPEKVLRRPTEMGWSPSIHRP